MPGCKPPGFYVAIRARVQSRRARTARRTPGHIVTSNVRKARALLPGIKILLAQKLETSPERLELDHIEFQATTAEAYRNAPLQLDPHQFECYGESQFGEARQRLIMMPGENWGIIIRAPLPGKTFRGRREIFLLHTGLVLTDTKRFETLRAIAANTESREFGSSTLTKHIFRTRSVTALPWTPRLVLPAIMLARFDMVEILDQPMDYDMLKRVHKG